jgi:hypothetical protein
MLRHKISTGLGGALAVLLVLGSVGAAVDKPKTTPAAGNELAVTAPVTLVTDAPPIARAAVAGAGSAKSAAQQRAAAASAAAKSAAGRRAAVARAAASAAAAKAAARRAAERRAIARRAAQEAAAKRAAARRAAQQRAAAASSAAAAQSNCTPGYSPCIPPASDVDCAGGGGNGPEYVTGPVYVTGSDPYDLDRDGDGVACTD